MNLNKYKLYHKPESSVQGFVETALWTRANELRRSLGMTWDVFLAALLTEALKGKQAPQKK